MAQNKSIMFRQRSLLEAMETRHMIFQKYLQLLQIFKQQPVERKVDFGNVRMDLFMTIALNRSLVPLPLPLHFLPLRVGTLLISTFKPYITKESSGMKLKWPNDILANGHKLCDVFIEMEDDHLLIGIGCNIIEAPELPSVGSDCGRSSTALIIYHNEDIENYRDALTRQRRINFSQEVDQQQELLPLHRITAKNIVNDFEQWITNGVDSISSVIDVLFVTWIFAANNSR